jgi:hypothetical protein
MFEKVLRKTLTMNRNKAALDELRMQDFKEEMTFEVIRFRRLEVVGCRDRVDKVITINGFKSKNPHIRVRDDGNSGFIHDFASGRSLEVNFLTHEI